MNEVIKKLEQQLENLNEKEIGMKKKLKEISQKKSQVEARIRLEKEKEQAKENEKIVAILREKFGDINGENIKDMLSILDE